MNIGEQYRGAEAIKQGGAERRTGNGGAEAVTSMDGAPLYTGSGGKKLKIPHGAKGNAPPPLKKKVIFGPGSLSLNAPIA